jgi:hypothetical protein
MPSLAGLEIYRQPNTEARNSLPEGQGVGDKYWTAALVEGSMKLMVKLQPQVSLFFSSYLYQYTLGQQYVLKKAQYHIC